MPKISVIIPSYNASSYVKQCVSSLFNQTFTDFEVIVIDDGATDESPALWDEYAKKDSRIQVFHDKNHGQAVARNKAIKKAKGDYITFVDADDTIDSDMLEVMYQKAITKDADLVWCELSKVENGEKTPILPIVSNVKDPKKDFILNNAGPSAKLIKRDLIIDNQLFFLEKRIYEDIAIVPSYALYAKKIIHIKKPMYDYRIYPGSTMKQVKYHKKLEDIFFAMDQVQTKFQGKYPSEIEYLYIHHLLHAASLRFFQFQEGKDSLLKIVEIMKSQYPNWNQNSYYKQMGIKFKIICTLFYKKQYWLLKLLLK